MRGLCVSLILIILSFSLPLNAADYFIGDGDELNISVWGSEQLSGNVTVRPDGKISLPAIGDVTASGQSPENLALVLEKVVGDLVQKPVVTVTVAKATNNRIYVSGGGVPSEIAQLPGRTSLFKFLCRFGDLTRADLKRSYLVRTGEKLKLDMNALFFEGDFSQDIDLLPEDILFIPPNEQDKVYVVGAVKEPRYILYRPGLKVLDAILEAGGFNEYADMTDVSVLRKGATGKGDEENVIPVNIKALIKKRRFDLNLALKPGDYVTVQEGIF